MNSPNRRHTSYRRSVYRKNSIKTIIISALCTLLVAAVLLVVIGNIILARLDKDGANDGQDGANDPPANEHANAKIVWACAVALAADGCENAWVSSYTVRVRATKKNLLDLLEEDDNE